MNISRTFRCQSRYIEIWGERIFNKLRLRDKVRVYSQLCESPMGLKKIIHVINLYIYTTYQFIY